MPAVQLSCTTQPVHSSSQTLLVSPCISSPCCSWGGGYAADSDSYKFAEAVHLVRKYAALPAAWSCPVGDGPFNAGVCFRHFGLYGDPWELLLFWRYMAGSSQAAATTCDNE